MTARVTPIGGLNLSLPRAEIADTELIYANNFVYSPSTGKLEVRPAFTYVAELTQEITNLHYYVKDATTAFLIVSCADDKLYYKDDSDVLHQIATLASGQTPTMLTFNSKLIWADGTGIYSWDGDTSTITVTTLTTAIKADAIKEIASRVVANDTSDYDSVYLSAPEDETDWNTSGSALAFRAGYGDGLKVNAFAVFGNDLLISKTGAGKKIYRLNTAGASSGWEISPVVNAAAADNSLAIDSVHNDILFVDESSLKSLAGVQVYGDIQVMNKGKRINRAISDSFQDGNTTYFVRNLPSLDMVWIGHGSVVYIYHAAFENFTDITIEDGTITAVVDANGTVYAGSHSGKIYLFDWDEDQDELTDGTLTDYEAGMRTKEFRFNGGEGIIRRTECYLDSITPGEAILELVVAGASTGIKNIELADPKEYLYDATGYLYDANDPMYSDRVDSQVEISRNRLRCYSFSIQLRVTSGRTGVEGFSVISAMVNG